MKRFLLLVISCLSLFACSKESTDNVQPTNPQPPVALPPVADDGLDSLGNWKWASDSINQVGGSQIVFVNVDTGYILNTYFVPSAGLKATYNGGQTWLPDKDLYHILNTTAYSRLYMYNGESGILYGQYVPSRIASMYEPYLIKFDFTSPNVFSGRNLFGGNAYAFIQDIQKLDNTYFVLTHVGTLYILKTRAETYDFNPHDDAISVYFTSAEKGWVGTEHGKLFATADGGKTWKEKLSEEEDLVLFDIVFRDAANGWIVTNSNILFRTSDGGENWQKLNIPVPAEYKIVYDFSRDLVMVSPTRGFINVDHEIYETLDGGSSWVRSCKVAGAWNINSISFDKKNTVWAVTNDRLLKLEI